MLKLRSALVRILRSQDCKTRKAGVEKLRFIQINQNRINTDHITRYRVDIFAKEATLSSVQETRGNVTAITTVTIMFSAGKDLVLRDQEAKIFLDKMEPSCFGEEDETENE